MSTYRWICCRSLSRSRTVAAVSSSTLSDSVPRSGLASTAMTRSPRTEASVAPRPTVVVVLPTPPLRLMHGDPVVAGGDGGARPREQLATPAHLG